MSSFAHVSLHAPMVCVHQVSPSASILPLSFAIISL